MLWTVCTAWPGLWGGAGVRLIHALCTDPPLTELPGPLLPAMLLTLPAQVAKENLKIIIGLT